VSDWLVDESLAPNPVGPLAPLYAAADRGELHLPFCASCVDGPLDLDQTRCHRCGGVAADWRPVAMRGIVHSVTTVHRLEPELIRTNAPYHVLDVELPSGHRLLMTTVGPVPSAPSIGDCVTIAFRRVGAVAVPAARPLEEAS
jgi:uncharacterized OB-fold protein